MSTYTQPQAVPVAVSAPTTSFISSARALSWGAIFAGSVAALSAHLLLTLLSLGIGLQTAQPLTNDNVAADITVAAGISWTISALIALWIGGWVAARFADVANHRVGRLHGFVVWSLATVVTFASFTLGAGALASGTAKLAGKTLSVAGAGVGAAAGAAAPAAGDAIQEFTQGNGGVVSSFLDEVTPAQNGQNGREGQVNVAKARREISWSLYRLFAQEGGSSSTENRAALAQTIAQTTGRSQADAERMVGEWVTSYDRVKQELQAKKEMAEQKAREAADKAADAATKTAIWTFIAFIVGAGAAIWGGQVGAKRWWNAEYPEVSRHPFPQP
ncbi:hypothetical protein CMV30_10575 [Nibricoccus aquaticus]|uniref:PhnA-like protein n=1 Tax=Nibricoccus aquaticus TaxID=2576891 RepID=A0A290Q7H6_9BACT|nr:hypothetical protein [Nibricoccus aquaticus]ATC64363.1 hypothetical protein CMV30_10575 [Nibricoccus aquaticus]